MQKTPSLSPAEDATLQWMIHEALKELGRANFQKAMGTVQEFLAVCQAERMAMLARAGTRFEWLN